MGLLFLIQTMLLLSSWQVVIGLYTTHMLVVYKCVNGVVGGFLNLGNQQMLLISHWMRLCSIGQVIIFPFKAHQFLVKG